MFGEKNEIKSRTAASSSLKKKAGELELDYHLNNIAEEAKTKMPDTGDIPKSKRVAGIRQNRSDEKTHERSKKAVTQGKTLKSTSNMLGFFIEQQGMAYGPMTIVTNFFETDVECGFNILGLICRFRNGSEQAQRIGFISFCLKGQ